MAGREKDEQLLRQYGQLLLRVRRRGAGALDATELLTALTHLALIADEYDDHIVEEAGGMRMEDLLNEFQNASLVRDMGAELAPWED